MRDAASGYTLQPTTLSLPTYTIFSTFHAPFVIEHRILSPFSEALVGDKTHETNQFYEELKHTIKLHG